MRRGIFLFLLLVSLFKVNGADDQHEIGSHLSAKCRMVMKLFGIDEVKTLQHLNELSHLFDHQNKKMGSIDGLFNIFQNKTLLPDKGVLHIAGIGINTKELIIPLLARPDITIVASDTDKSKRSLLINTLKSEGVMKPVFQYFSDNHPEILKSAGIDSTKKMISFILERVSIVPDLDNREMKTDTTAKTHTPSGATENLPLANFVLARYPLHFKSMPYQNIRDGGYVWLVSENKELHAVESDMFPWIHLPINDASLFNFIAKPEAQMPKSWEDDLFTSLLGYPYLIQKTAGKFTSPTLPQPHNR